MACISEGREDSLANKTDGVFPFGQALHAGLLSDSLPLDVFARAVKLPSAALRVHPDEGAIVTEALREQRTRLMDGLGSVRPDLVITLGNAALRVFKDLLDDRVGPEKLTLPRYGAEVDATV